MSDVLISVCIPAFNHAPYIGAAIHSALAQGIDSLEVIVIDDASTDETAAVVEQIANSDARVRLFRNESNLGPGAASQAYLHYARGRYIATLPSDDLFLPNKLQLQLQQLEADAHLALSVTAVNFMDAVGRPLNTRRHFAAGLFEAADRTRGQWLRKFFDEGNNVCASSVVIRSQLFRQIALPDHRLLQLQDYDCWVRLVLAGYGIGCIDQPLTKYRIHDNLSRPSPQTRARTLIEQIQILSRFESLKHCADLESMLPESPIAPPHGVREEPYVQHLLALHAWSLATPQHRVFAINNWYRILGVDEWRDDLQSLGVNARFLSHYTAHHPLPIAIRQTPIGALRANADRWLPTSLRRQLARLKRRRARTTDV